MRRRIRFGRWTFLLALLLRAGVSLVGAQEIDRAARVSASVFDSLLDRPAQVDSSGVLLNRMLLLLQPSAAQRQALNALLAAQQTSGNPEFHKWVAGADFADRFALSAVDAGVVATWLQNQGFVVAPLPVSRGWVEFSGTTNQVKRAFGARVIAGSGTRYALAEQAVFPALIADKVQGLVSLDGSYAAVAATAPVVVNKEVDVLTKPSSGASALTLSPAAALSRLHLDSSKTDIGSGETVAIPARSNVRAEDFAAFRTRFHLPDSTLNVILNGGDPGRTEEEAATMQALSWAGAAAPGAQIDLVSAASTNATDGLDLALAAAIDSGVAGTISVGFSSCESGMSAVHQAFYAALYRQAAAEGIAVIAASGDSGAAACHSAGDHAPVSTGLAVSGLASTPWNLAVGAVDFATGTETLTGWQPSSSSDAAYATGGGASRMYAVPLWQSAQGMPTDDPGATAAATRHRYLPDVSLPAAASPDGGKGLAFCFSGDQPQTGCRLVSGGGSAAAAAVFAGIAARLAEKYGPQGNLAPNLYALRQMERGKTGQAASSSFVDVTEGAAKLWCATGSSYCGTPDSGQIGFSAAAGYDLVSGLGSVNAESLIRNWTLPQDTGTSPATVEMTNTGGITYNPSAIIVLSAKVISGSGGSVPTGTIQFFDETTGGNTGSPVTLAADGTASYSENGEFTDGGHNIAAKYSGDSTYEAAESQPVTINIQPSATSLVVGVSTTTPAGGATVTVTGTVTSSNPGNSAPTGTLTVNLDGLPQGNALLATTGTTTSASVGVVVPTAGSHTIQGMYSGDLNYNNSTSQSITINVAKVTSVTSIAATPSTLTAGVAETFTATVAPATAATGATYALTGTVSFYDAGVTLLGTAPVSNNTAILTGISLSGTVAHTITAVYSGDTTYTASTSSPLLLTPILLPVTVTLVASNSVLAPDQPVSLTATVNPVNAPPLTDEQNPSGFVLFYAGSALISGQVPVVQGLGNTGIASTTVPNLPTGQYVVTARYSGDTTFGPAVSNSLNLQAEDFTISCNSTNINMVQGTTQTVTCNVASLGGLSGPIEVSCAEQNPPQVGAIGCTFSPNVIQSSGQTTLTIVTLGGDVAMNRQSGRPGTPAWPAGGLLLAGAGQLFSPVGRRVLRLRSGRLLGVMFLLASFAFAGLGCSNSVNRTNASGTPLGVHTLKLTAAAAVNTVSVSHNAYLTVNVTP